MDWQEWPLNKWNEVLVSAVFFDEDRIGIPINRISASDRFLSKCVGDSSPDLPNLRKAFIQAFGANGADIKSHFNWSNSIPAKTRRLGIPPNFAALYLTLLAASADETTYNEGNFRRRFIEIVRPVDLQTIDFRDLPKIWEHVEGWSRSRAAKNGDCRILQLPDPLHETLIGYSKRLAFPTYRDETRLQEVLKQSGLDGNCDFRLVARAVATRLSYFGSGFNEEFSLFNNAVAKAQFNEAYESPFWGAVRDISWEHANENARTSGSYCLGVDITDPYSPQLYLLADDVGKNSITAQCQVSNAISGNKYRYVATPKDRQPWTPEELLKLTSYDSRLRLAKLWQGLIAGCVIFFRDQYGNMTSDGEHSNGASVCFLSSARITDIIQREGKRYGLKSLSPVGGAAIGSWKAIFYEEVSSGTMVRLLEALPEPVQARAGIGWKPPHPTLSGGAWYGQSLLLNPASNPIVRMEGATSGTYDLLDGNAVIVASGDLEPHDDGFRIPPIYLVNIEEARQVSFTLYSGNEDHGPVKIVPLAGSLPLLPPKGLEDPTMWLVDGPAGKLSAIEEQFGWCPPPVSNVVPMQAPKLRPFLKKDDEQFLVDSNSSSLDALPPFLDWQCEALSLRFQRRAAMPFAELNSHLIGAAEAADVPLRWAQRLLFNSGWTSRVQRRNSPYPVFAPAPRTITIHSVGQHVTARISGMFPKAERARLSAALYEGEAAYILHGGNDALSIGAFELRLCGPERIHELAQDFNCSQLMEPAICAPLAPADLLPQVSMSSSGGWPVQIGLEVWVEKKYTWEAYEPGALVLPGTIARLQGTGRMQYFVSGDGVYWKTDSFAWACIFRLAAQGEPIGTIAVNGDCRFHLNIPELPPSLVRWWLHWGGGYISIPTSGHIIFGGGRGQTIWDVFKGWFAYSPEVGITEKIPDRALERRGLALRLRLAARR